MYTYTLLLLLLLRLVHNQSINQWF